MRVYYTKLPDHTIAIQVKGITHIIPTTHVNYKYLSNVLTNQHSYTEDSILPFLVDIPKTKYVATLSSREFCITRYDEEAVEVVFCTKQLSPGDRKRGDTNEIIGVFASFEEAAVEFCEYVI